MSRVEYFLVLHQLLCFQCPGVRGTKVNNLFIVYFSPSVSSVVSMPPRSAILRIALRVDKSRMNLNLTNNNAAVAASASAAATTTEASTAEEE